MLHALECGHVYHDVCLNQWAIAKSCGIHQLTCAVCKQNEVVNLTVEDAIEEEVCARCLAIVRLP